MKVTAPTPETTLTKNLPKRRRDTLWQLFKVAGQWGNRVYVLLPMRPIPTLHTCMHSHAR